MTAVVVTGGGWWPPGDGEPGEEWEYAHADLKLLVDPKGDQIDVVLPTPDGDRGLCSIPVTGLAHLFVAHHGGGS